MRGNIADDELRVENLHVLRLTLPARTPPPDPVTELVDNHLNQPPALVSELAPLVLCGVRSPATDVLNRPQPGQIRRARGNKSGHAEPPSSLM
ncbi:hypothetical protein [Nonomuraea sp. WAC 01424]|uniref:hypothetical protein n=1 Tax=Nonomuraea sp. WAC 01424 TaxID=2203200 RepID=UPI000F7A4BA6|nr:hypothetical protein [Nonomuraea sp. WAC 01424]